MNSEQQQAALTLALLAAFADGANDERERAQIHRLAETLGGETGTLELPGIYPRVLLAPAEEMQARYLPQIQQRAGNLDVNQIMTLVRGG